ncbi:MAG: 2'-5' RNA ligase family protein [Segetibacter sp.]
METGLVQKTLPATWNQPDFYEYLLVALPGEDVYNKVMAEKQAFYGQFEEKTAIKTKPHITIANFLAREAMEETIIRYMQRICNGQPAFDVMLNNYSGFPPHTIYIRVQNPQPFRQLAKELKAVVNYVHSCGGPPVNLITNPHISIARSLPENVYFKALMQYSQKTFHETFTVSELVLLRGSSQFDNCKSINVFHLKPSQNTLFN